MDIKWDEIFHALFGSSCICLIAGTLSIRLILNAFKLNHYIQVFFVMGIAFFASLMFQILRTLGITWKVILSQHLNILSRSQKL